MKKNILIFMAFTLITSLSFALPEMEIIVDGNYEMETPSLITTYNEEGRIEYTDDNYGTHIYNYDNENRLISIIDENGNNDQLYEYDNKGRLVHKMEHYYDYYSDFYNDYYYSYDENNNMTYKGTSEIPDSSEGEIWEYDENGNEILYKNYNTTMKTYYKDGLKIKQTYEKYDEIYEVRYYYDHKGQLTYIEDLFEMQEGPKLFEYDNKGNMTYMWHDNEEHFYEYNSHNDITFEKDSTGNIIKEYFYKYDDNKNIIYYECYKYDGTEKELIKKTEYDEKGNLIYEKGMNYPYEYNSYKYDEKNLLIEKESNLYDGYYRYIYTYDFDENGNIIKKYDFLVSYFGGK